MKTDIVAGFNVSCVGDDRQYSYLPSRRGDTISDLVAVHVLHVAQILNRINGKIEVAMSVSIVRHM